MSANEKYKDYPEHPLYSVPQEILDAARAELDDAVLAGDVEEYISHPIADAVVINLLPWLRW